MQLTPGVSILERAAGSKRSGVAPDQESAGSGAVVALLAVLTIAVYAGRFWRMLASYFIVGCCAAPDNARSRTYEPILGLEIHQLLGKKDYLRVNSLRSAQH
jgi:hypothetical protein